MGKYPVIFITLKGAEGRSFNEAVLSLSQIIKNEAKRFSFLRDDEKLDDDDKSSYGFLLSINELNSTSDLSLLKFSLKTLSQLLYKHYGKKVIILIDEYDVPLDKAYQNGYYDDMVSLLRGLFGEALKINDILNSVFLRDV